MKKLDSIKKFVIAHKVAFAVTGVASLMYIINRLAIGQHDTFLKEHGLYDAFYALTDED